MENNESPEDNSRDAYRWNEAAWSDDEQDRRWLMQRVDQAAEVMALNAASASERRRQGGSVAVDIEAAYPEEDEGSSSAEGGSGEAEEEQEPPRTMSDAADMMRREFQRLRHSVGQNREAETVYCMLSALVPFILIFVTKVRAVFIMYERIVFDNYCSLGVIIVGYIQFLNDDNKLLAIITSGTIGWQMVSVYTTFVAVLIALSLMPSVFDMITFNIWSLKYESFFSTVYYTLVADIIAKHLTITVKATITLLPTTLVTTKRKRRCYQFVEYLSQFYRSVLPLPRWIVYLCGAGGYEQIAFTDIIVLFMYCSIKSREAMVYARHVALSLLTLCRRSPHGTTPSKEEIAENPNCSICYDPMHKPVKLSCSHTFCEDCVDTWLDREQTCPMCRAQVDKEDNTWKSGTTSKMPWIA